MAAAPIDVDEVAEELGIAVDPDDQRLAWCTDAAVQWCAEQRPFSDPERLWGQARVRQAGRMYAALLYRSKAQPQGMPGLDELGDFAVDTGMSMSQIYRLIAPQPRIA